jgi:hypothetical protein
MIRPARCSLELVSGIGTTMKPPVTSNRCQAEMEPDAKSCDTALFEGDWRAHRERPCSLPSSSARSF